MAEAISDKAVLAVLRPFVRAAGPVLHALRESDPFGLRQRVDAGDEPLDRRLRDRVRDKLATVEVPGSPVWAGMDVDERGRWWVYRVGRFTTLLASVPGIGGALADRLPLQAALGSAGQGLLLCALAGEHGVHDEDTVVSLLGAVLFRRDLRAALAAPRTDPESAEAEAQVEARAAELTGELTGPGREPPTLRRVGSAVWHRVAARAPRRAPRRARRAGSGGPA